MKYREIMKDCIAKNEKDESMASKMAIIHGKKELREIEELLAMEEA